MPITLVGKQEKDIDQPTFLLLGGIVGNYDVKSLATQIKSTDSKWNVYTYTPSTALPSCSQGTYAEARSIFQEFIKKNALKNASSLVIFGYSYSAILALLIGELVLRKVNHTLPLEVMIGDAPSPTLVQNELCEESTSRTLHLLDIINFIKTLASNGQVSEPLILNESDDEKLNKLSASEILAQLGKRVLNNVAGQFDVRQFQENLAIVMYRINNILFDAGVINGHRQLPRIEIPSCKIIVTKQTDERYSSSLTSTKNTLGWEEVITIGKIGGIEPKIQVIREGNFYQSTHTELLQGTNVKEICGHLQLVTMDLEKKSSAPDRQVSTLINNFGDQLIELISRCTSEIDISEIRSINSILKNLENIAHKKMNGEENITPASERNAPDKMMTGLGSLTQVYGTTFSRRTQPNPKNVEQDDKKNDHGPQTFGFSG